VGQLGRSAARPLRAGLHLEGFDGPIDLLLDLAERQRLDLGRISLVALVDQFVAACALLAPHVLIERRADWLVMATRLVPRHSDFDSLAISG
jgi:segregation and condensation protein A